MNGAVRENSSKDTGAGSTTTMVGAPSRPMARPTTGSSSELVSDMGKTTIADTVVGKIVGMAAREVPGVYAMGDSRSRAMGAFRERLPGVNGPNLTQGVAVEVGQRQAAVDMDLIAEYGVSIPDLADGVRRNVIEVVEKTCGLQVIEVNIAIADIHLPDSGSQEPAGPRVQ
jgi:uncharacterized alkaline shock family protein YloU